MSEYCTCATSFDGSCQLHDRIDALTAENAALKAQLAYAASTGDECAIEVEELRKDAERYRWLVSQGDPILWDYLGGMDDDQIDEAIDKWLADDYGALAAENAALRDALYKSAEYATLFYDGSALIDGRIVDGLGLALWIKTLLESATPEQEPAP
jgi:hypothetical protein